MKTGLMQDKKSNLNNVFYKKIESVSVTKEVYEAID